MKFLRPQEKLPEELLMRPNMCSYKALVLHRGDIVEMKTGEGKTLTSVMAVYLNALEGKGVHVVTAQ